MVRLGALTPVASSVPGLGAEMLRQVAAPHGQEEKTKEDVVESVCVCVCAPMDAWESMRKLLTSGLGTGLEPHSLPHPLGGVFPQEPRAQDQASWPLATVAHLTQTYQVLTCLLPQQTAELRC